MAALSLGEAGWRGEEAHPGDFALAGDWYSFAPFDGLRPAQSPEADWRRLDGPRFALLDTQADEAARIETEGL